VTDLQAIALLFVLMGGFFVGLAIAPPAVVDRIVFWRKQAHWFRSHSFGLRIGRVLWGCLGLFLWVIAGFVVIRQ
jgi:hypothetical protein